MHNGELDRNHWVSKWDATYNSWIRGFLRGRMRSTEERQAIWKSLELLPLLFIRTGKQRGFGRGALLGEWYRLPTTYVLFSLHDFAEGLSYCINSPVHLITSHLLPLNHLAHPCVGPGNWLRENWWLLALSIGSGALLLLVVLGVVIYVLFIH